MALNKKISLAVIFVICLLFGSAVLAGNEIFPSQECITDACVELLEGGIH